MENLLILTLELVSLFAVVGSVGFVLAELLERMDTRAHSHGEAS